jgi:hypothetical protein
VNKSVNDLIDDRYVTVTNEPMDRDRRGRTIGPLNDNTRSGED